KVIPLSNCYNRNFAMAPQTTTVFKSTLLIVFMILGNHSLGTNFYFSTSEGDDSRNFIAARNPTTPWKTISKLNEVFGSLQRGDTVFVEETRSFMAPSICELQGHPNIQS